MGAKTKILTSGELHPRETQWLLGNLGSLNAEIIAAADGCASVSIDLRGTFNLTVEISGTLDDVNWVPVPVKPVNQASKLYVAGIAGAVAGVWVGAMVAPFRKVRARVTAYTSGLATATLAASTAPPDISLDGMVTSSLATAIGAAGAAVTLTLASPGAGLRHYLTYLSMARANGTAAALTAAATLVTCTTTNLPGALAFTRASDALAAGAIDVWREDFAYPLSAAAQATATTIVCPATTGVIWRVTAGFYVAP